ncbi:MAG TPA: DUF6662 family protein [Alphaproteobacteria bacterium]|nr:DUF6662 family protein [Alphaproteobacteria bacterium]
MTFKGCTLAAACAALMSSCAYGPTAFADEPVFGYVYTTDLLPQDRYDIEQWITDRDGQAYGYYHAVEGRTEFEYGVTDNFQLALYLNYAYVGADHNSVHGLTEGSDIKSSANPFRSYGNLHYDGLSVEATYRVLSPYTDPVGLAFYVEPEIGPKEYGVELRGIVQKNFFDDRLVLAGNVWVEFEREAGSNLGAVGAEEGPAGNKTNATYAELDLGASYRFAPNWSAGIEFRNHREYGGYSLSHSDQDHTAYFVGPNIHYANERWYATISVLRQISAIGFTDDQKAEMLHGRLYGDEHTTWDGLRLIVGRSF